MRAFVAGATGLTGRYVVEALVRAGVEAVAHVRPDSASLEAWRARFAGVGAVVDASPWSAAGMVGAMQRWRPELVFALLGTTQARARKGGGDYEAVDVGLTLLLVDAVVASGVGARVVYLSALGAERGRGGYLGARRRVEAYLRGSGLAWTIARPSLIVGDRDDRRVGERVARVVVDGAMSVVGALGGRRVADRWRSIEGQALAAGLVRVALDPAAAGQVFQSGELRS